MKELRYEDLRMKVRGRNLLIETDFGPASAIDVFGEGDKLVVFGPVKVKKDDFLDFLEGSEIEKFTEDEIQWAVDMMKEKGK